MTNKHKSDMIDQVEQLQTFTDDLSKLSDDSVSQSSIDQTSNNLDKK